MDAQPWYAIRAVPVLSAADPTRVAWVARTQAGVMLAALRLPLPATGSIDMVIRGLLTEVAPVVVVPGFGAAGVHEARRFPVAVSAT